MLATEFLKTAFHTLSSLGPRAWLDFAFIISLWALLQHLARFFPLYVISVLPSTIAHECAHWVIGFVLGTKPQFPSFTPVNVGGRWRLGEVTLRQPSRLTLPFVALAPLTLLPLAFYCVRALVQIPGSDPRHWAGLYLVAMISHGSLPSAQDWHVFWRSAMPAIVLGAIAGCAWLYFRVAA